MAEDVVDLIGTLAAFVDPIERITCGLLRQRWDINPLEVWRDGGNSGRDAETNIAQLTELFHCVVYLFGIRHAGVEYRFGVVEHDDHVFGGQEWPQGS